MGQRIHPIDAHVGRLMRLRRTLLGFSQERLGDLLGLTFQQVQKYERGANRVSSGRLFEIARALDVPVSFFFEGLEASSAHKATEADLADSSDPESNIMSRRETLELVRAYYRISDPKTRAELSSLMQSIAGPAPGAKRRGRPPKKVRG